MLLASYDAQTNRELRLAALTLAFSFGALDALSRAASGDLTLNQVMRLRGNANALNRAAMQNENKLDALRQPTPVAADPLPEDDLPASMATAERLAQRAAQRMARRGASAIQTA